MSSSTAAGLRMALGNRASAGVIMRSRSWLTSSMGCLLCCEVWSRFQGPPALGYSSLSPLAWATVLFNMHLDLRRLTLLDNRGHPRQLHGTIAGSTLAADNHPINAGKHQESQRSQQRLTGQKAMLRGHVPQDLAAPAIVRRLNGHPEPHMRPALAPIGGQMGGDARRAFGEDEIGMLRRAPDDVPGVLTPGIGFRDEEVRP